MGEHDNGSGYLGQPTMVGGDRQVEPGLQGLRPGNDDHPEPVEQFRQPVVEGIGAVPREHDLHPRVAVEDGDGVEQPGRRRDIVGDHQNLARHRALLHAIEKRDPAAAAAEMDAHFALVQRNMGGGRRR